MIFKMSWLVLLGIIAAVAPGSAQTSSPAPLRVGIVGLVHGHAGGFLGGGALVPAGAALHRPDIQVPLYTRLEVGNLVSSRRMLQIIECAAVGDCGNQGAHLQRSH